MNTTLKYRNRVVLQLYCQNQTFPWNISEPRDNGEIFNSNHKLSAISEKAKLMVHMEDIQKYHEDYPGVCKKENEAV